MLTFPIVDAHVHLFDVAATRYGWLKGTPLDRSFTPADFLALQSAVTIEAAVFAEVVPDEGEYFAEADWVAQQARRHPFLKGMVARAPLERGSAVAADLDRLQQHAILRGIRRGTQEEADPRYCLRDDYMAGVREVGRRGLVCDLCVFHHQLPGLIELVSRFPDMQFVLDHIGKPGIRAGLTDAWKRDISELAKRPNVSCKISGVVNEADHASWTVAQIRPYIEHAIEAFGFDRCMFGGDWPVLTLAGDYAQWLSIVDDLTAACSEDERRKLFRDTATAVYRL